MAGDKGAAWADDASASASSLPHTPAAAQRLGNHNMHTVLSARLAQTKPAVRNPHDHLTGVVLGTNRAHDSVIVKRQIGAAQGYDDRWQATAVARLAKVDSAAVVLAKDGRWYALETTARFDAGRVSDDANAAEHAVKNNPFVVEVHGVPPLSDTGSAGSPQARAAAVLGVPESDIRFNRSIAGRAAGVINIIGQPEQGSSGAGHAPLGGGAPEFQEGVASTMWLDLPEIDRERAPETLFHETQHLHDWDLAQTWIRTFTKETGHVFVKSVMAPFAAWLHSQVKKNRLTKAEVELILMEVADATAYTEARANVRSFLADLQAGNAELAKKSLVGYAHSLKPKSEGGTGVYASPASGSEVEAALVKELEAAYAQMSPAMKRQYDDAVAAAKSEYPRAWISVLDFSKRGAK